MGASVEGDTPVLLRRLCVGEGVGVHLDEWIVVRVVDHSQHQFRCPVKFQICKQRLRDRLVVAVGRGKMRRRRSNSDISIAVGPNQLIAVA